MKFISILLVLLLLSLFLFNCETTNPGDPPEVIQSGYQDDILWPSLADSPWPIQKCDAQNSGRSKYAGPTIGNIQNKLEIFYMNTVPVFDENNKLILVSEQTCTLGVLSNYSNLASYPFEDINQIISPIVDNNNNIYLLGRFYLRKVTTNGEIICEYNNNAEVKSLGLTIDKQGNIYFVQDGGNLKVISSEGKLVNEFQDSRILNTPHHLPAFSPDGNTIYLQGSTVSVIALDLQSYTVKWTFGNSELWSNPSVDASGNIYLLPRKAENSENNSLSCINENGELQWSYPFYHNTSNEVTISKFGDIVFGILDTLYSVSPAGETNWKLNTDDFITSSPTSDKNGNIYFTTRSKIIALESNGNYIFETNYNDEPIEQCIIDSSGFLILTPANSNHIFIIK